jgi:hypothetical protein
MRRTQRIRNGPTISLRSGGFGRFQDFVALDNVEEDFIFGGCVSHFLIGFGDEPLCRSNDTNKISFK